MKLSPQQYLGKYKLLECLGKGGMAEVWKAFDPELQRFVAIKIAHPELQADPEFLTRFKQEGRLSASLRHPNIVKIHSFEIAPHPTSNRSIAYIVLEYIKGTTLKDYLACPSHSGKFLSRAHIMHLFTSISSAIDYAHREGMLHRDIKPANILLDSGSGPPDPNALGEPILSDFGIAKVVGVPTGELTRHTIGTPLYMSPEQAQGESGDERSDIYSLGVILYEICTGMLPFQGGFVSLVAQKMSNSPPSPHLVNPNIQPALAAVILRSLAKDPSARYPTASALIADLERALFMPGQGELGPLIKPSPFEQPLLSSPSPLPPPAPSLPPPLPPPGPPLPPVLPQGNIGIPRKLLLLVSIVATLLSIVLGMLLTLLIDPSLFSQTSATSQSPVSPTSQIVGEVPFVSSGQFNASTGTGINDGLQIDLHAIADPASGKSYYAWLMGDNNQSDTASILLGKLTVTQGIVHLSYQNPQHDNLLAHYSNFLITEEDAQITPVGPSLDHSAWKYNASFPQMPDPTDKNRFSRLDHLRHLLAADPNLQALKLPGGLDIWMYTTMGRVSNLVGMARGDWDTKNTNDMRQQLTLILDYLDGKSLVQQDLPPTIPPPTNAPFDSVGLLGQQNQEPLGYLSHINTHLSGLTHAPGGTQTQSRQAIQINNHLNQVSQWLEQVRADAKRLLQMGPAQLLSQDGRLTLDDMKTQADYAYNGGLNQEGVRQIYIDIQQLATFEVQPYSGH